jgi:glycosyltransferase involved in cell wall biosynthesis
MNHEPLVSIIIDNYNYGRFVQAAIDSALYQDYSRVEVIVVDDGSTDNSREIIACYDDRIIKVLKENAGQASAFNAGFARSHGSIIIFLDADDALLPSIVSQVVNVYRTRPDVAKIQYRLEVMDAAGNSTGIIKPSLSQPMPNGDMRLQVLSFPDDILWQPTSGNAFPVWVLQQLLPMPEHYYRICADYYLANLPPLFGSVASLDLVGGYYRVHGSNNHSASHLDLNRTREIIVRTHQTHRYVNRFADMLGLSGCADRPADVLAVTFLAHRMVSLKLDPRRHPFPEDRIARLLVQGIRAALRHFDLPWTMRALQALWFIATAPAPKPLARWLAELLFFPEGRGALSKLVTVLRRGHRGIPASS